MALRSTGARSRAWPTATTGNVWFGRCGTSRRSSRRTGRSKRSRRTTHRLRPPGIGSTSCSSNPWAKAHSARSTAVGTRASSARSPSSFCANRRTIGIHPDRSAPPRTRPPLEHRRRPWRRSGRRAGRNLDGIHRGADAGRDGPRCRTDECARGDRHRDRSLPARWPRFTPPACCTATSRRTTSCASSAAESS